VIKRLNYFRYSRLSLIFKKDITFLIIFGGIITSILSYNFAFATPEEEILAVAAMMVEEVEMIHNQILIHN
jgi:hypothetical protein